MSVLSSYTLLSRAAPPLARKFSGGAALPPVAATVSLPRVPFVGGSWRLSSRAPLFVCVGGSNNPPGAQNQKNTYDIHPNALRLRGSTTEGSGWKITEDNDKICLELELGEDIDDKDKLEVATTEDQVLLIRCKVDSPAASKLDVRLLMPQSYDGKKVTAEIIKATDDNKVNKLKITIKKPDHQTTSITIT